MYQNFLYQAVEVEGKNGFSLEYYITQTDSISISDKSALMVYGVEVIKTQTDSEKGVVKESRLISDICCSQSRIKAIAEILSRNTVTPICLGEVLQDLILQEEGSYVYNTYQAEIGA